MSFVKAQVCGCTKEELLKPGVRVTDACALCQDAGVLCRIGHHKSRERKATIACFVAIALFSLLSILFSF